MINFQMLAQYIMWPVLVEMLIANCFEYLDLFNMEFN